MSPAINAPLRACLVVLFFVCPLLFFTNLTRNPYITQICLLNAASLLAGAWLLWRASGERRAWPRTAIDAPLAAWVGVCVLSWSVAFALHRPFFRPAIAAEGSRAFLFLIGNVLCPFYVAAAVCGDPESGDADAAHWAAFAVLWALLWLPFSQLRGGPALAADVWGHLWDGYGAFVWAVGLAGCAWLCRKGRWGDFLHLALAAGFIASAYAVLQYFNLELIWPNTLNPYGGRSVSTFGNPNFMSSFNVVLLPFALALFSRASGGRRAIYGALALTLEAALLCSLTRSSWLGAGAALALLLLSKEFRSRAGGDPRPHGLLAAAALAMALLWPASLIGGYTSSVVGRISEVVSAARTHVEYSSVSQRVMIWTCGWLMGRENPLTGKGYGLFELFYPFYQGPVIGAVRSYRILRTHANNGHNEIIETFSQTGLLGLGVVVWLWTTFFAAGRRWLRAAGGRGALYAAAVAGAAGMLVDNMLNVSLHFAVPAFLFWWAAGLALAPAPAAAPAKGEASKPLAAWARAGLRAGAGALAALCWVWVCVWMREVHYFAGLKLLREKSYPLAIQELERSRSWGPPEVNAIYELGNAYAQAQRFPEADEAYRRALRANAGYDEIYYNVGAIKSSHLGQTAQAIDFFRVANFINPLSAETYTSLGNLYLSDPARYGDAALELLQEAVRFFPDNPNHWNNLGYLYTLRRRWDDAERAYTRALLIDPNLAVAARNLEAVAVQARRPRPKILSSIGDLRELEGRIARRDYSEQTLALSRRLDQELPDNAQARFFLGSLLMARGQAAQAVAALAFAAERQPGNVWVHVNLGEAYRLLGRRDEARAEYRAALGVDAGNPVARQRLSELGP